MEITDNRDKLEDDGLIAAKLNYNIDEENHVQ